GEGSTVPVESHHTPSGGYTPGSDEGSLTLNELMILCITLSNKVESLETKLKLTKQTYGAAFTKLIKMVNKLKKTDKTSQARRRVEIVISDDDMSVVKKILADATRVHTYSRRRRAVSTGSGGVSTASKITSTTKEIVSTADVSMPFSTIGMVQESTSSTRATKDKGKAIMIESDIEQTTTKDAKIAQRLQEEINAAKRQRIAQVHQAAQTFIEDEWENIKAKVEADEELTQRLQAEEREKYSEDDRAKMLVDLIN
nr:hypothetical protein [Tanacetum cinerariifolium]